MDSQTPDTQRWRRVHPLSPLARFWFAILIALFAVGRNFIEDIFEGKTDAESLRNNVVDFLTSLNILAWLGLTLLIVVVLGGMFLNWWFTRFTVTADSVRVRQGWLFRTDKQARLDRVQSIEIFQPFMARLVGLAELRFDVADSGDAALHLQYLRKKDAEALREQLLGRRNAIRAEESASTSLGAEANSARSAGADQDSDSGRHAAGRPQAGPEVKPHPESETSDMNEAPLASVGPGRAIVSTLLGGTGLWFLVVLCGSLAFGLFLPEVGGFVFVPAILSLVGGVWSSVNTGANFTLTRTCDGFRMRYGLTSTRTRTLPLGRIQAVGIDQPLLWRIPGWFRVRINSAGLGTSSSEEQHRTLLPVGTGQDLMNILPHVVETSEEGGVDGYRLRSALEGSGPENGFVVAPRRSRWLDPFNYRRNGYATTPDLLLLRGGWLRRRLSVVPHERTQSVALESGPLLRRLGLATARLDSVGGEVSTKVEHLATEDVREMIREQAARAAFARRISADTTPGTPTAPRTDTSLTPSEDSATS